MRTGKNGELVLGGKARKKGGRSWAKGGRLSKNLWACVPREKGCDLKLRGEERSLGEEGGPSQFLQKKEVF